MKCSFCNIDLPENLIQDSHDIPCYIFKGMNRKEQKKQADKYGRRWLCISCHERYEEALRLNLVMCAARYSKSFFGEK